MTASHPRRHRRLHRSDFIWSAAVAAPYAGMFLAFVVYPIGAALWMVRDPSLYATLLSDKHYLQATLNTTLFVGIGVNVQMRLSSLLSSFFARRRRWIKMVLIVFMLPWTLPAAVPTCHSTGCS